MKPRMHVILDEIVEINNHQIYCKVLSPTPVIEDRPYLLGIPGGPGFSHASTEGFINKLQKKAASANAAMPNVILFDPLGCGVSDKAKDATDYSMNNFTEIAAKIVEFAKQRLCPERQMDLRVYGGSFGSLTAMDLPLHRSEWLNADAAIHLRQIISHVGPNGVGDNDYTWKFVETNYKDHPHYEKIKSALGKLLNGEIQNQDDYIESIVYNLAPLYSKDYEKLINSFFGKLLRNYHHQIIPLMKVSSTLGKKLGFDTSELEFLIMGLTGCSIDVLNQFCKTDHNTYDTIKNVSQNLQLYQRTQICLISSSHDHMCNPEIALRINQLLPDTSGAIILEGTHHASRGLKKETIESIFLGLICQGHIPEDALQDPVIRSKNITPKFQEQLQQLSVAKTDDKLITLKDSTTQVFSKFATEGELRPMMPYKNEVVEKSIISEELSRKAVEPHSIEVEKEPMHESPFVMRA